MRSLFFTDCQTLNLNDMKDEEIQKHIEQNCRNAHGEPMIDEQAFYEGAKWYRDKVVKNNAVLPHVMSSCPICQGRGEYTTGGSFGGSVQVYKCDCGAITP